jgi:hypothetical protein
VTKLLQVCADFVQTTAPPDGVAAYTRHSPLLLACAQASMSGLFRRNKRPRAAAAESRTQDPALQAPAEAQNPADAQSGDVGNQEASQQASGPGQSGANPESGASVQPGVSPQSGAGKRSDADAAKQSGGSLWTSGRKVDSPAQPPPAPAQQPPSPGQQPTPPTPAQPPTPPQAQPDPRIAHLPAGTEPSEELSPRPTTRRRGRMRKRLRFLQRMRELLLRDLGGLVYEIHRTGSKHPDGDKQGRLVTAKVEHISVIDAEMSELEARLSEPRGDVLLREPGVGGACSACGELYGSDSRFCSHCGMPLPGNPYARPIPAQLEAPPRRPTGEPIPATGQVAPPARPPAPPQPSPYQRPPQPAPTPPEAPKKQEPPTSVLPQQKETGKPTSDEPPTVTQRRPDTRPGEGATNKPASEQETPKVAGEAEKPRTSGETRDATPGKPTGESKTPTTEKATPGPDEPGSAKPATERKATTEPGAQTPSEPPPSEQPTTAMPRQEEPEEDVKGSAQPAPPPGEPNGRKRNDYGSPGLSSGDPLQRPRRERPT